MSSLEATDQEAAAQAVAPRVSLADIEAAISLRIDVTGDQIEDVEDLSEADLRTLETFSFCLLIMRNGFVVIGKSAPASPENYRSDLGRKFAYEDAVRQLWPLMGYALREKLASAQSASA